MSKRILLLVHPDLIPPQDQESPDRYKSPWITEYDVYSQLKSDQFDIEFHGLYNDLDSLQDKLKEYNPHIVFNLLEEFNGDPKSDYKIVSLLEMLNIKYTGCNSKGLLIARDKALSKKVLKHHKIATPNFLTFPKNKKKKIPKNLTYPLIVKCLYEEGSFGLAQASIVNSLEKLKERLAYIHTNLDKDAIIEEFIEGKEFYVGVIGNKKLKTLPIWELQFENVDDPEKEIYSSRAKWNEKYRKRKGIKSAKAQIDKMLSEKIMKTCKKTYQVLNLSGYARIDLRVTKEGRVFVIEANPNPNIAIDEEFTLSAMELGYTYSDLLKEIM
jgi:D-alanine-D-alanine ligase